jgi:hypothetical protein
MRPACGPLHLLVFAEALADHLIHGRLHKAGADPFPVAVTLTVVGNEATVMLNVGVKLLHRFQQLACDGMATRGHRGVAVHFNGLHHLQGLIDVPVLQIPFQTC